MLEIYLLRHGQTLFNIQDHVQGWNDSPLTELGIYQARCAGYGARDIAFDRVYSGDTPRQVDTARIFLAESRHPTEIIPDMHFREMCYGKYQGGSYYDMLNPLFEKVGAAYEGYLGLYRYYDDYQIAEELCLRDETGETEGPKRVWKRFKEGLDRVTAENESGKVLISTSSCAIAVVLHELFPDFVQSGLVDNASLTVMTYDKGRYQLKDYNDISYRKEGEAYYKGE